MNKIQKAYTIIRHMDEKAAALQSRLNPSAAICTVFVFVVTVTSFGKYTVAGLLPLLLFPVTLMARLNISYAYIAKRVLFVAPFILCFALFNLFFEQKPYTVLFGLTVSYGLVSFIAILIKFTLTISIIFVLVMWFGINPLAQGLAALKVPRLFINQLLFMHRYLLVLIEEAARSVQSVRQRSFNRQGVPFTAWGSFAGHLLMRTIDRAERIYAAMRLRLYSGVLPVSARVPFTFRDGAFLVLWTGYFVICRSFNLATLLGRIVEGG